MRAFFLASLVALPSYAAPHTCAASLDAWRQILGADWIDCHQRDALQPAMR